MLSGYEFFKGPWQDVDWLVTNVHQHYADHVTSRGLGSIWEVTKKKIIERRKWQPSLHYYADHFEDILEELGIVYIPKQMDPGPGVLFPLRDYRERLAYGKLHPFYELVLSAGVAKYGFLGKKPEVGANYFGQTDRTLRNIARTRSVGLVEGYYDLLACRLMMPDAPILSTGTKSLNEAHVQYLRLLGIKDVYLMLDNDTPKEVDGQMRPAAGLQAMQFIQRTWQPLTSMKFHIKLPPADDQSMCLEAGRSAKLLKDALTQSFD